MDVNEQVYYVR